MKALTCVEGVTSSSVVASKKEAKKVALGLIPNGGQTTIVHERRHCKGCLFYKLTVAVPLSGKFPQ
ncbi:hypothetical protein [Fervidibacter sacchari]